MAFVPSLPVSFRAVPWGLPMGGPALPAGATVAQSKPWRKYSDAKRLKVIRDFIETHGADPRLRWLVADLFQRNGIQERDYPAQAACILKFAQDGIYYTNEQGEQLQSPWITIQVKTGDCDDHAILVGAMAESIRLPWRLVLAGKDRYGRPLRWAEPVTPWDPKKPPKGAKFYHIYVDLGFPPFSEKSGNTTWMPAEPTIKGRPLGWDPVMSRLERASQPAALPELAGVLGSGMGFDGLRIRTYGYGTNTALPQPTPLVVNPASTAMIKPAATGAAVSGGSTVAEYLEMSETISWKGIALGALQSALTALLVQGIFVLWESGKRKR